MSVSPAIVSSTQGTPGSSLSVLPTNAHKGQSRAWRGWCSCPGEQDRVPTPGTARWSHRLLRGVRGQEEFVAMAAPPLPSPAPCPLAVSKMQSHLLVCGKDMRGERVRTRASPCLFPCRLGHSPRLGVQPGPALSSVLPSGPQHECGHEPVPHPNTSMLIKRKRESGNTHEARLTASLRGHGWLIFVTSGLGTAVGAV